MCARPSFGSSKVQTAALTVYDTPRRSIFQFPPVIVPAIEECSRSAVTTWSGWSEVVVGGPGVLGQLAGEVGRSDPR